MPFIHTITNRPIAGDCMERIKAKYGEAIACMGKSENYLMVGFSDQETIYFKGDGEQPAAFVDVSVFGSTNAGQCESMTKEICTILQKELGIDPSRIYIKYSGTNQWGWNSRNF